jgi:hypothetical protein
MVSRGPSSVCERGYFSVKLPKLNIMTNGQPLSVLNCLFVVRANQFN